jgi:predicted Zn-dependent peptidase
VSAPRVSFSALDPAVATTALRNGLRVTTVALPHLHTATVSMFIKVGSRFETPEDSGLSHFVEHMLFRGTAKHPTSLALNTAVEELGSTLHAETGRDYTLFQMALEPSRVPAAIALLGELLGGPRFSDIELERALVLEELNEDYDEDGVETNVDDIARGLMFGRHPLGQRVIGPRANIQRFSDADVRRHFAAFYGATNAILCVSGPVDHERIVAAARRGLAHLPAGQPALGAPAPPPPTGPIVRHVRDAGSQTNLAVLFHGVSELDPGYLAFVALLRVLDDGMSTRLHYQLADQKGLAYSIHAGIEPLADVSLFEIAGATANTKVPELLREILALLGGLCQGQIDPAELAKARARYRYETLASIDDAGAMAAWFGGVALYYPPQQLSRRLAAISRISVPDVIAAARRVFRPENLVITAVGALSRAKAAELRDVVASWDPMKPAKRAKRAQDVAAKAPTKVAMSARRARA